MVQTVHNCGVPQLRCPVKVVDVLCSSSTRCGRPCDLAGTGDSLVQFWMVVDMPVGVQATGGRCPCCCSSSTSCGRPCDCAVTGFCSWMCLKFRSLTEWWKFQLLHRDRYAQCITVQKTGDSPEVQFLDRLDTPVVVQRQAAGFHSAENCGRSAIAVL